MLNVYFGLWSACDDIAICLKKGMGYAPLKKVRWLVMGLMSGLGLAMAQNGIAAESTIQAAWDRIYEAKGDAVQPPQTPGTPPSWHEYTTLRLNGAYQYNAVDFSGDPTVGFAVDDGPALTVTPAGVSFPQAFESGDHKLRVAGALGTHGFGHERVNTYLSGIIRQDLDGTPEGSPFQSILDAHGGGRYDLSNAFVEMNGLSAEGVASRMQLRLGRQFIPDFHVGLLGSAVIDGGRFAYTDLQLDAMLFAGRWSAFYQDVSATFVGGGRFAYRLFADPAFAVDLEPYVEYLNVSDTEHGESTHWHTYGVRGRWKALEGDLYISLIDEDPIELRLQGRYATGDLTIYSHFRRRLSSNAYVFDAFFTVDDLSEQNRLTLDAPARATEFAVDADYQLLSWLIVGAGTWFYILDEDDNQRAFDASFVELNARLSVVPPGAWSGALQYRFREVDRDSNTAVVLFDDTRRSGETVYHEINAELRYRWKPGVRFLVGGYTGVYDTQNRLSNIDDTVVAGAYARASVRVTKPVRLRFFVGVDRGNEEFNPDIDLQYTARLDVDINY